jgi:hypothetical protein
MYKIFSPHPNPPLIKGRELDFIVSPIYKGGLRGVINFIVSPIYKGGLRREMDFIVSPIYKGGNSSIKITLTGVRRDKINRVCTRVRSSN